MLVVFPVPLTPRKRMIAGVVSVRFFPEEKKDLDIEDGTTSKKLKSTKMERPENQS
jgi:hypothetical protein